MPSISDSKKHLSVACDFNTSVVTGECFTKSLASRTPTSDYFDRQCQLASTSHPTGWVPALLATLLILQVVTGEVKLLLEVTQGTCDKAGSLQTPEQSPQPLPAASRARRNTGCSSGWEVSV